MNVIVPLRWSLSLVLGVPAALPALRSSFPVHVAAIAVVVKPC